MDGASGSKTIGDPQGLLRSALEKIVFFECRVSQLEAELAAARSSAERARGDASRAERRGVELEQALAAERGARADAARLAEESGDRVRLLEAERERLLGGLVDRARVSGAAEADRGDAEEGSADLAGFIAELRAEIDALRTFKAQAEAAGFHGDAPAEPRAVASAAAAGAAASAAPALSALATRLERSGRVGVTVGDAERMKSVLPTRADRALYERSLDDLSAPDAGRRLRAVHALEALGSRAAAPILAAALGREREVAVKCALLGALGRFQEPFAAALAERALEDGVPAVRVAALDALAAATGGGAEARLAAALEDPSPLVRRRAVLLLGFQPGDGADDALAIALSDADRGVARAAAAALSGRPTARAQEALSRGLDHPDLSVRRAASVALQRLSGVPLDAEAPASARRAASRRVAQKLAAMNGDDLRAAVFRGADQPRAAVATRPSTSTPTSTPTPTSTSTSTPTSTPTPTSTSNAPPTAPPRLHSPLPLAAPGGEGQGEGARPARTPSARVAVAVSEAPASDLDARIVFEIRAALRGCTAEGLASVLAAPQPRIEAALEALAVRGAVARRGTRWFMS